jgi:lysophospholipase L1-like esterase
MPGSLRHMLFAGSSHTRRFFPYAARLLGDEAAVSALPGDAGRTDEILASLPGWPLEGQDLVHLYAGHRDLMRDPEGRPFTGPERFGTNLESIVREIARRTPARIVLSNVPPVSDRFLETDPDRNRRIALYNGIILEIARKARIPCHDFWGFISSLPGGEEKYVDGLHFRRTVYRQFARTLVDYVVETLRPGSADPGAPRQDRRES